MSHARVSDSETQPNKLSLIKARKNSEVLYETDNCLCRLCWTLFSPLYGQQQLCLMGIPLTQVAPTDCGLPLVFPEVG